MPETSEFRTRLTVPQRLALDATEKVEEALMRYSLLETDPVFEGARFPWASALEAATPAICAELEALMRRRSELPSIHELSPEHELISTDRRWKIFILHMLGVRSDQACRMCPQTARAAERIPGMRSAAFSILEPGARIPPHRGYWRGLVRCHLGLIVPEPAERCRMRVGDKMLRWRRGGAIFFDDTYEHEAWNETDGERVVLFLDIERPLRFPGSTLNHAAIRSLRLAPLVRSMSARLDGWEADFFGNKHR